jgi:cyclophilin family peptidyl-prolyl cis-trans isomerase
MRTLTARVALPLTRSFTFCSLACSLACVLACSGGSGNNAGTSTDAGATDAASSDTGTITTGSDAAAEAADGATSSLPSCFPVGYTLVPFLTASATTHKYTKADQVLDTTKQYAVALDTDAGCIAMSMYTNEAPITCNSFAFLALHHYYDGIAFHRVIDGFMAQTGDPNTISGPKTSWGAGGPGYAFGLEVTPSLNYDGPGTVGMARTSDPNSNGSQFFITFAAAHTLDQQYTIFMKVIGGSDVLPSLARSPSDGVPPTTPTRIKGAYIGVK